MALFNYATKEITLKIVYYGPGLSGKTTNLQHLHQVLNPETKGKLLSLATESDRTLFFDFLPIEFGKIRDFSIRFQLYTVPGQVRYNATRKVVLKGADAVVFVADSQKDMKDQNIESFENMRENLASNNINPDTVPIILQYNKRDLKNILSLEELNQDLNQNNSHEVLEATAINGMGVEEAFKRITKLVLKDISKKHKIEILPVEQKKEAPALPKAVIEARPEPVQQEIRQEPEKIELKAPVYSTEPVFDIDAFEIAEEELEIVPDHEADVIEIIEEAEPLEAVYEPELTHGWGHTGVAEVKADTPAPEPVFEEPVPFVSAVPWTEMLQVAPVPEEMPIIEEPPRVEIPPPEPVFEEPVPSVSAVPWTEMLQEAPITEEISMIKEMPGADIQPFPIEKIESLSDDLARVSGRLSRISDAIALLQKTVSDLKGQIVSVKNEIALSKEKSVKEPELKDLKEFKELLREQKEISGLLSDVLDLLSSVKEKKSWFKL